MKMWLIFPLPVVYTTVYKSLSIVLLILLEMYINNIHLLFSQVLQQQLQNTQPQQQGQQPAQPVPPAQQLQQQNVRYNDYILSYSPII